MNYTDCPQCRGTGGPPPVWDEELGRSIVYVCSRCSGSGYVVSYREVGR